jgi:cobalt-zinc-cadmium efflux system membrane fusion protein
MPSAAAPEPFYRVPPYAIVGAQKLQRPFMIGRVPIAIAASVFGIALASYVPQIPETLRNLSGLAAVPLPVTEGFAGEHNAAGRAEPREDLPQTISLDDNQIETAGIELAPVQDGTLTHHIIVPGTIVPNPDRTALVSAKLSGTVAELRKKVGDNVAVGELMAVLESRDVASAKSDYLAARLNSELQKNLYDRNKDLWDRRVIAEQVMLKSQSATAQAKVDLDIARQKLIALGLTEKDIAALPDQPQTALRRQEILAPMAGQVIDRKVDLGAVVGRDNLETQLFTIADLERVWVELAVGPSDLPLVAKGQIVSVTAHGLTKRATGKIVFISPILDRDTHSARVVVEIANPDGNWRPGSLVTAAVSIDERKFRLTVPTSAVQSIGKAQVVFVRTPDGFEKRDVMIGQSDDRLFEILSGAHPGEIVAVTNTFALKAEFMKSNLAEE